jgi:cell division septation protein DedD
LRDLERIREVREYRVTGPQLVSLCVLVAVLVAAAGFLGFQLGVWQRPVDEELLLPADAGQEASAVLADLLAERDAKTSGSRGLTAAEVREQLVGEGLTARDDTRPGRDALPQALPLVEATPEPTPTPAPSPPPTPTPTPAPSPPPTPTPTPAPPPPPTPAPAPTPTPAATPPTPASDGLPPAPTRRGWTVQLAAYETPAEARALIRTLQAGGHDVFHQEVLVNGTTWHRVRVGLYPSREAAESAAARLANASPYEPFVTRHP